jgi:predicted NBD/HSP70 family sugar kinase
VGEALAAVVTLLNPEAVVVGGDMAAAYDVYVAGLRETLHANALPVVTRHLELVPSTHGPMAGVVGCAAMALDEILSTDAVDALVVAAR